MNDPQLILPVGALNDYGRNSQAIDVINLMARSFELPLDHNRVNLVRQLPRLMAILLKGNWDDTYQFYEHVEDNVRSESSSVDKHVQDQIELCTLCGLTDAANVILNYFALVQNTGLVVAEDAASGAQDQSSIELINQLNALQSRWSAVSEGLSEDTVKAMFCDQLNIGFMSEEEFDEHWIDTIIGSKSFQKNKKRTDLDQYTQWLIDETVTAALKGKGYQPKFAFWQSQTKPTYKIYAQTRNGPIRVDAVNNGARSLENGVPIEVETTAGKPLFKITYNDIPLSRADALSSRLAAAAKRTDQTMGRFSKLPFSEWWLGGLNLRAQWIRGYGLGTLGLSKLQLLSIVSTIILYAIVAMTHWVVTDYSKLFSDTLGHSNSLIRIIVLLANAIFFTLICCAILWRCIALCGVFYGLVVRKTGGNPD